VSFHLRKKQGGSAEVREPQHSVQLTPTNSPLKKENNPRKKGETVLINSRTYTL